MISRRKVRIKALQALYMGQVYDFMKTDIDKDSLKKYFRASMQQTEDAVLTTLAIIYKIHLYAEKESDNRNSKYIKEDAQESQDLLKLGELDFVNSLKNNDYFQKKIESLSSLKDLDAELIRSLFRKYAKLPETQEYLKKTNPKKEDEEKLLLHLIQDVLIEDSNFQDLMEANFPLWYDDEAEVLSILSRMIKKGIDEVDLSKISTPELFVLGDTLIDTAVDKREYYQELINPRLQNWDPKRIARIDMLILYLGLSEFLYLDTVPLNVTINEYIDITKQYAADQSKQFINALLDGLKKDLESQNLIDKKEA